MNALGEGRPDELEVWGSREDYGQGVETHGGANLHSDLGEAALVDGLGTDGRNVRLSFRLWAGEGSGRILLLREVTLDA